MLQTLSPVWDSNHQVLGDRSPRKNEQARWGCLLAPGRSGILSSSDENGTATLDSNIDHGDVEAIAVEFSALSREQSPALIYDLPDHIKTGTTCWQRRQSKPFGASVGRANQIVCFGPENRLYQCYNGRDDRMRASSERGILVQHRQRILRCSRRINNHADHRSPSNSSFFGRCIGV